MKKLTLALAVSAIASSSAFADYAMVSGSLGNWKSWNAGSKAPIPYFVAAAGVNLVQANNAGDNIQTQPGALNIAITGTANYDDLTGAITSMSLYQVGSYTGWWDTDGDLLADDSVTFSGYSWTYANGVMALTGGTASGCQSSSPACVNLVEGGAIIHEYNPFAGQSVFDFQGISAGFKTLPRRNSAGTGYGTFSYKVWAATAGASAIANINPANLNDRIINVASMINSGTVTTNSANTATFSLSIYGCATEDGSCETDPPPVVTPIPASAWLLGSGLIGLAGIKRRRK